MMMNYARILSPRITQLHCWNNLWAQLIWLPHFLEKTFLLHLPCFVFFLRGFVSAADRAPWRTHLKAQKEMQKYEAPLHSLFRDTHFAHLLRYATLQTLAAQLPAVNAIIFSFLKHIHNETSIYFPWRQINLNWFDSEKTQISGIGLMQYL